MKKRSVSVVVAVMVFAMLQVAAEGADATGPNGCADELERLCSEVPSGAGRILLCLQQHDSELSTSCRATVQKTLKRVDDTKQACAGDVVRFCAGVAPGHSRLTKCLSRHLDELDPACRRSAAWIRHPLEQATTGSAQ